MSEDFQMPLLWPRYIEKKQQQRTLAYFKNFLLVTEHGLRIEVLDLETFKNQLFAHNLLVSVESVPLFPFLEEALGKEHVKTHCTEEGIAIGIVFTGQRRSTRWVVSSKSWGYQFVSSDMLAEIRATFTHCQVGTANTAGALGQKLMREAWKREYGLPQYEAGECINEGWKGHRHQRPNKMACDCLQAHQTGARSDTFDTINEFDIAFEIDRKNAYAAAFLEQPTGHCFRITSGPSPAMLKYFVRCTIEIKERLVLGPFPIRIKDGKNDRPVYPTQPGIYETWGWNDEVTLARSKGCMVVCHEGYGWYEVSRDMECWVRLMSWLRETAPTREVEQHIKHAIVAGIGRFGMGDTRYELIAEEQVDLEKDKLAEGENALAYGWFVHATVEERPMTMPHWFSHTLMQCRIALYKEMLPYAEREQLIATNTDAGIVRADADISAYPQKGTPGIQTGVFSVKTLLNVTTPAARHLEAIDARTGERISKRPGIPRSGRGS
jgi:hypothetical protein